MSGSWLDQLQPASWRGLGFAVNSSSIRRGRRTTVHEYPFRDQVWVEDLGRGVRAVAFSGFVVGDDCFAQRDALLAASEMAGPGELIHPSLGSLNVALVSPMEATERKDLGRVVEISFEFVEDGLSIYPDDDISTTDVSATAADDADDASTGDFLSSVGDAVSEGAAVVSAGLATASTWAAQVTALSHDASLVTGAVAGLSGNFGRYASGARSTLLTGVATAEGAIAAVGTARAAVSSAASTMIGLAGSL